MRIFLPKYSIFYALTVVCCAPTLVEAAEDEMGFYLQSGMAFSVPAQDSLISASFQQGLNYGLTESTDLLLEVDSGLRWDAYDPVFGLNFGFRIAADILRVIPFAETLIRFEYSDGFIPGLKLGLGAEYLLTSSLRLGLIGRLGVVSSAKEDIGRIGLSVRIAWHYEL